MSLKAFSGEAIRTIQEGFDALRQDPIYENVLGYMQKMMDSLKQVQDGRMARECIAQVLCLNSRVASLYRNIITKDRKQQQHYDIFRQITCALRELQKECRDVKQQDVKMFSRSSFQLYVNKALERNNAVITRLQGLQRQNQSLFDEIVKMDMTGLEARLQELIQQCSDQIAAQQERLNSLQSEHQRGIEQVQQQYRESTDALHEAQLVNQSNQSAIAGLSTECHRCARSSASLDNRVRALLNTQIVNQEVQAHCNQYCDDLSALYLDLQSQATCLTKKVGEVYYSAFGCDAISRSTSHSDAPGSTGERPPEEERLSVSTAPEASEDVGGTPDGAGPQAAQVGFGKSRVADAGDQHEQKFSVAAQVQAGAPGPGVTSPQ